MNYGMYKPNGLIFTHTFTETYQNVYYDSNSRLLCLYIIIYRTRIITKVRAAALLCVVTAVVIVVFVYA